MAPSTIIGISGQNVQNNPKIRQSLISWIIIYYSSSINSCDPTVAIGDYLFSMVEL